MKLRNYLSKSCQILFLFAGILLFFPIKFGYSEPVSPLPTLGVALIPTVLESRPEIAIENQKKFESQPGLTRSPGLADILYDGLAELEGESDRREGAEIVEVQADVCEPNPRRPCFDDLSNHYLDGMYSSRVFKEIGGVVAQNYKPGRSACALRLSKALNYSGYEIPFIEGQTGSGSDGRWYFYRVLDLGEYLVEEFGPPDLTRYLPEGVKALEGKKGIVYFRYCEFRYVDAYGHVDLFDGDSCTRRCPRHCYDVQFWEMP